MSDDGWVPFANRIESPNFGYPRGTHGQLTNPIAVVDHIMAGYFEGCRSWFRNPESWASSTFGISKNGDIDQYVSLYDCAWANGAVLKPDPIAAPVYTDHNPNVVTWSSEHAGWSGEPWTEAMYQADLKLKRYLWQRKPDLILLGHCHIDSVNKANCPGPTWPRERLLVDLKGGDMAALSQDAENWVKATIADMIKKAGPKLIRISGQDEIMELRADGLFHIDGETYLRLGYDKLPVEVVAKDDPILKRRVSYPAGVPAEMH